MERIDANQNLRYYHDQAGRPYAKLSELKVGDLITIDGGFKCTRSRIKVTVMQDEDGKLYFECDEGNHLLEGQADDGEHCIGIYGPYHEESK